MDAFVGCSYTFPVRLLLTKPTLLPPRALTKPHSKGEVFDLNKHPQGTEVKAITYSNMQVHADAPTHDVYVILDI